MSIPRCAYTVGLTALLLLIPVRSSKRVAHHPTMETLICVIPQENAEFQRGLVEKYAQDLNLDIHVYMQNWPPDSLMSGAADMMVLSENDTPGLEGIAYSRAFADGTAWAVRDNETEALRHINHWITEITASERFNLMQQRYLSGKAVSLTSISRYDSLLKEKADSIGWDWRLLAAVVYHESRFRNDATSRKGARGLMQIRSDRYSAAELANPSRNLSLGSRYLQKLQSRYETADSMEAVKFALAAYNLGESRVSALITRADSLGLDASRWENVATLLPQGHHTISYVNNVLDTYAYYSRVYPR